LEVTWCSLIDWFCSRPFVSFFFVDAGASDAADWAIARSLSALRRNDRGALNQPGKDGNAPDEATGSAGESDSKGDRSV
jgi:hypothetical protein